MSKTIEVWAAKTLDYGYWSVSLYGTAGQAKRDRPFVNLCPKTWMLKTGIKTTSEELKHIRITFEEI